MIWLILWRIFLETFLSENGTSAVVGISKVVSIGMGRTTESVGVVVVFIMVGASEAVLGLSTSIEIVGPTESAEWVVVVSIEIVGPTESAGWVVVVSIEIVGPTESAGRVVVSIEIVGHTESAGWVVVVSIEIVGPTESAGGVVVVSIMV